jgi:hypothetical protein
MRADTERGSSGGEPRQAARARKPHLKLSCDPTVALIRKLRWIGEDAEAVRLEHALRTCTRFDTTDPALYETD